MIRGQLTLAIPGGVWNIRYQAGGEAIMARIDLRHHRFTQRPPTTLNLLLDKYFETVGAL